MFTTSPLKRLRQSSWMEAIPDTINVPPFGYRVDNRKLLVDEKAAEHVRWIFARFLEIGSCTVLAREVAARGLGTPRGNRIDKKYLYRMLSNRAYLGEAVHKVLCSVRLLRASSGAV